MFGLGDHHAMLLMMNHFYHVLKWTEADWMTHVDLTLPKLMQDPHFANRDPQRVRERFRRDWQYFVALSDKQ